MDTFKVVAVTYDSDVEEIEDVKGPRRPKKRGNVGTARKNSLIAKRQLLDCQIDINLNFESKVKKSAKSKTTYEEEELFVDLDLIESTFELKFETSVIKPRFEVQLPQKPQKPQVPIVSVDDFDDSNDSDDSEEASTTLLSNESSLDESQKTCNVIIPNIIAPNDELENVHILFDENVNVEYIHSWKSGILEEIMERYD